jgi:hypothetical protein
MPQPEELSIEIANQIGYINGRLCAVGTVYLVRVKGGRTLRSGFDTRQQAEEYLAKRDETSEPHAP